MDNSQFVAALYQGLLARSPDEEGFSAWVTALEGGRAPEEVIVEFLRSKEFRAKLVVSSGADLAPAMDVELDLTPDQERLLWVHVAQVWSKLGSAEPYWSVCVEPRWKMASVTLSKRVEAFYATGRQAVYRIDKWLERNRLSLPTNGTCVEYGCGVGRCTVWLARRFAHVLALDISEPHLRLAQERAKSEGLKNIEFVNIKEKDDLAHINNADFFYSTMVLQHNPPPIIASILRAAFSGLNPGGVAFFQVPTHSIGYFFNIEDYTRNTVDRGMEMHFFPQAALFALASDHGMRPLEVSADNLIGNFGRWTSSSFLLKKL